jgi:hypothetical protein
MRVYVCGLVFVRSCNKSRCTLSKSSPKKEKKAKINQEPPEGAGIHTTYTTEMVIEEL